MPVAPSTHRTLRRLIASLLGLAVLIGVGIGGLRWGVDRAGRAAVVTTPGSPTVLVGERTNFSMLAIAEGKLADVNGCLGFASGDVIVWPPGTHVFDGGPVRVKVGTQSFGVGDVVRLGGGHVDRLRGEYLRKNAPRACVESERFWDAG